jgi:hypothetical protein
VPFRPIPSSGLHQVGFRGRNDDGNETAASWIAAENTNWTQLVDTNVRTRFVVIQLGGTPELNVKLKLQRNLNSTGWFDVTGGSSVVKVVDSPYYAEEQATTRQLVSGSGTFFPGAMDNFDGVVGTNDQLDFAVGTLTEVEFCYQLVGLDLEEADLVEVRVDRVTP